MKRLRKLSYGALSLISLPQDILAIDQISVTDQGRSSIELSSTGLNRLYVKGDRIKQIYGDIHDMKVDHDPDTGQLFMKFQSWRKDFEVTVVTENGLTHDLDIHPHKGPGRVIQLTSVKGDDNSSKAISENSNFEVPSSQELMIGFIKDLALGKGENSEKIPLNECTRNLPDTLEFVEGDSYKKGGLQGEKMWLKNISGNKLTLSEDLLKESNDLGIYIENPELEADEGTLVIIVNSPLKGIQS